ncbi:hypothetical protein ACFQLX_05695 [Streptomyces polyrhachis]|uniref:Gram-positive cocci surface proteins LPxTG domain-containing protein n=1 Tax=Streptomyces polyrhachis TaxID=1282885 RepID=A0ABW2GCZ9_9ACTN
MRTISTVLAASALSVLAVGVTAPATAQGSGGDVTSFGFTVTPKAVKPGGQVNLTATDCEHEARASSGVFDSIPLGIAGDPMQSASVTVDWDAKPGAEYTVTFICGPESGRAKLRIAATSGTSRPRPGPSTTSARPSQKPGKSASASASASASGSVPASTPASAAGKEKGSAAATVRTKPSTTTSVKPTAAKSATVKPTASQPVRQLPGAVTPVTPVKPAHPARGGLGGSQTGDPLLLASGTALTCATLAGAVILRRRRSA